MTIVLKKRYMYMYECGKIYARIVMYDSTYN